MPLPNLLMPLQYKYIVNSYFNRKNKYMTEKEKKILARNIKKWISISIFACLLLFLLLKIVLPNQKLSSAAKELNKSLLQNSNNATVQRWFILGIIREQEQYSFNNKRKNKELIEKAIQVGKNYLSSIDSQDFYIQLALARLHFQIAGIEHAKGEIINATQSIKSGLLLFKTLSKTYENNLILRIYRAINLSNLPEIFQQSNIALNDFSFIAEKILSPTFDIEQELEYRYYQGTLIACLKKGIEFAKEKTKEKILLDKAIVKIREKVGQFFEQSIINEKKDITIDMLLLQFE